MSGARRTRGKSLSVNEQIEKVIEELKCESNIEMNSKTKLAIVISPQKLADFNHDYTVKTPQKNISNPFLQENVSKTPCSLRNRTKAGIK